ncbi:MAG: SufS family cysteine desulfurase [Patescibacteria group bacterium]|nr:SufS family cysteine desulfurase [Patescibacteria group bacterium]
MSMFDPHAIRRDFPILQRRINGKPIIYLDSAATSLKPQIVLDEMAKYYTEYSANIHRGIYQISEEATAAYEKARENVARYIGAPRFEEIIFTRNATEGFNLIAQTYGEQHVREQDSIVVTIMDHHANFVPWQQLAKQKGANFCVIPVNSTGIIEQKLLSQYITRTTKIFAFPAISNVLSSIQNVKKIIHVVKELSPECCVVVDAAQAVAYMSIDVQDWNADFVVFSGHKMFGPTGIGVVWGKYEILEKIPPYQFGGDMIREVHLETSLFADPPQKFEAGTPNIAGAIGLGAAVNYITTIGIEIIQSHERAITLYALESMRSIEGLVVFGPDDVSIRANAIAFHMPKIHPHDIASILNEENICIRAGHHCAMPLHKHLGVSATARASFSVYTTYKDIDIFVQKLHKVQKMFS